MSGQQRHRDRERWWSGGGEGKKEHKNTRSMLQPGLLKKELREGKNGKEVCDAMQTDWPSRNSRGRQKASRSRAAQSGVQSGPESYIIE